MSMRERIARGIYEKRNGVGAAPWAIRSNAHKEPYLMDADAALDALMEPTEGMIGAFHRMCDDNGTCLVKPGFQAMIRAAQEGK